MYFIIIGVILFVVLQVNKKIDTGKFIKDTEPYFRFLMEDDYKFLLQVRYGENLDINKLYGNRVRNGLLTIVVIIILFIPTAEASKIYIYVILAILLGFIVFKMPYTKLSKY